MGRVELQNGSAALWGLGVGLGFLGVALAIVARRRAAQGFTPRGARNAAGASEPPRMQWIKSGPQRKVALVTGASSGIGAEFARQLAALGYDVVLVARRQELLEKLAEELHQRHRISAEACIADLANPLDVDRLVRRVEQLDGLDLLVNNAGFGTVGKFSEIDVKPQLDMIAVHVVAPVRLTRAALPGMLARRRGAIINVSSIAALIPLPRNSMYSATKAYLNVFSEALQGELRGSGVKLQALCPGFTRSNFHDAPDFRADDPRAQFPAVAWLTASEVVSESLAGLDGDDVIVVPSAKYRLLASVARTRLAANLVRRFA
jgi:uncharacterized protein